MAKNKEEPMTKKLTLSSAAPRPSNFTGCEGATSIKAEIISSIPAIQYASHYREVRKRLQEDLEGAAGILRELCFAGFVDPDTNLLKVVEKPFNVFAHIAAGELVQPSTEKEQFCLGEYRDRFMICCNRAENDMHWDSSEPAWINKASMARKHRFLTTKNLHWQWFNALVFGLAPLELGGVSIHQAVEEIKDMRKAALKYASSVGGWSTNVGLFVNIFGHNSVNSLFIHVLDMDALGPPFKSLSYKNLKLDDVIKVLEEEAAATPVMTEKEMAGVISRKSQKDPTMSITRRFFFPGTDGATSVKGEITARIPVIRDAASYREARRLLDADLGGIRTLWEELAHVGWVDRQTNLLTTDTKPFNIFARLSSGVMPMQPGMEAENEALGVFGTRYMICKNRPENDEHWDSDETEWVGKASMSLRHRFLTTKNLHWCWFNALVFGKMDPQKGGSSLAEAIAEVKAMKAAALAYVTNSSGWSSNVGLFFHIFGHNTVNSLHIHILDLSAVGPTFAHYRYKNCPLEAVLKVLEEEHKAQEAIDAPMKCAADAASSAAEAAQQAADAVNFLKKDHECRLNRNLRMNNVVSVEDVLGDDGNILELNIGGKLMMSVARSTLLLAPEESLLYLMFCDSWNSPPLVSDGQGRIFLDFPAASFERIVDHLRLIKLAPSNKIVQPPVTGPEHREFNALANILGVAPFLSIQQRGRSPKEIVIDASSKTCCSRWCSQEI